MRKRNIVERGPRSKRQCIIDLTREEAEEDCYELVDESGSGGVQVVRGANELGARVATDDEAEAGELERAVRESLQSEACAELARGQNQVIEAGLNDSLFSNLSAFVGVLGVFFEP